MARTSWDAYFLGIAREVATRATCDRKHVGAVIVRDKTILSTGYNGSVRGLPHCDDEGHLMENTHCVRTVHAEANAIVQAARNGVRIDQGTIYVTAQPCWDCFRLVANAGIVRIVYGDIYRGLDDRVAEFAAKLKIELVDLSQSAPDFIRASGNMVCSSCGNLYAFHSFAREHQGSDGPYLRRLCNGALVKL